MITEDERFIKIQGILAMSDVHPSDCVKINDLIIELSKESKKLKEVIEEVREYVEELKPHWLGNDLVLNIIDDLLQILDKVKGE